MSVWIYPSASMRKLNKGGRAYSLESNFEYNVKVTTNTLFINTLTTVDVYTRRPKTDA